MTYQFWQIGCQYLTPPSEPCMLTIVCRTTVAYTPQTRLNTEVSFSRPKNAPGLSLTGMQCPFYLRCTHQDRHAPASCPSHVIFCDRCERTAWYSLFMFTFCTLLAQVVLTARFGVAFVVQRPGPDLVNLLQDLCPDDEKRVHCPWVCIHYYLSACARNKYDNTLGFEAR